MGKPWELKMAMQWVSQTAFLWAKRSVTRLGSLSGKRWVTLKARRSVMPWLARAWVQQKATLSARAWVIMLAVLLARKSRTWLGTWPQRHQVRTRTCLLDKNQGR